MNQTLTPPKNATLRAKYGMEPLPESIARLSALIASRDADLSKVAEVVAADEALTFQLLGEKVSAAIAAEEVERQIFRMGVEPILVLAMSDPLINAVQRTFRLIARMDLQQTDAGKPGPSDLRRYTCSLGITGRANGKVFLRLDDDFGVNLAAKVLQIDNNIVGQMDVVDVLAELSNMIVGSFQSNLCDARLPCRLSVPDVAKHISFTPPAVARGRHRAFAFRHQGSLLLVDLLIELAN